MGGGGGTGHSTCPSGWHPHRETPPKNIKKTKPIPTGGRGAAGMRRRNPRAAPAQRSHPRPAHLALGWDEGGDGTKRGGPGGLGKGKGARGGPQLAGMLRAARTKSRKWLQQVHFRGSPPAPPHGGGGSPGPRRGKGLERGERLLPPPQAARGEPGGCAGDVRGVPEGCAGDARGVPGGYPGDARSSAGQR